MAQHNSSFIPFFPMLKDMGVSFRPEKRRRRKREMNMEEEERQRIMHIQVERNRRKLMTHHLSILASLLPPHHIRKRDQASIIGGAIDFIKELEQLLQSLEAQKQIMLQPPPPSANYLLELKAQERGNSLVSDSNRFEEEGAGSKVEVTLIESHANIRIVCPWRPNQLSKMVLGFHKLCLSILHMNVTSMRPMVFYSFSTKVEEDSKLMSGEEIAGAVDHMVSTLHGKESFPK
ncbi:transcription factor bHLH71-like [Amborella trichopoda]|nr:transcription factor bHLH71-like [Amborella trichopoda]|eukprot:XP_020520136.1 transcription factor bHLH71-like [Amborella trichopoda]